MMGLMRHRRGNLVGAAFHSAVSFRAKLKMVDAIAQQTSQVNGCKTGINCVIGSAGDQRSATKSRISVSWGTENLLPH